MEDTHDRMGRGVCSGRNFGKIASLLRCQHESEDGEERTYDGQKNWFWAEEVKYTCRHCSERI